MKYRAHRGALAESMETEVNLEPTFEALAEYLGVSVDSLEVKHYSYDTRINWDSHIVKMKDGVVGFTDRMPT